MSRAAALLLALAALGVWPASRAEAPRGPDGLLAVPRLARVSDSTGVLAPQEAQALDAKLAAFEVEHGSQIAIVVVESTQPEPIEDFAHRVGEAWKIGRAGIGDGVLILVAVKDRRARIDVARSLEGAIPDALASRIIRERMGPHFAKGDYAGGLSATLDGVFALIEGENLPPPNPAQERRAHGADNLLQEIFPFVIGGLFLGALLRRLFGPLGALAAGGVAGVVIALLLSSIVVAAIAGVVVFLLSLIAGPAMLMSQMAGGRGGFGGFGGGGFGGGGGGGFGSGGGGDFSGGGASGSW